MPRKYGKTELGQEINRLDSRTDFSKIRKSNTRYGVLYKSVGDRYVFIIKLINDKGEFVGQTGPIPLVEPPQDLAARYGSPKEMENIYMVKIDYKGNSVNRGLATIMKSLMNPNPGQDYEDTANSNELAMTGAAFAIPGAGLV